MAANDKKEVPCIFAYSAGGGGSFLIYTSDVNIKLAPPSQPKTSPPFPGSGTRIGPLPQECSRG